MAGNVRGLSLPLAENSRGGLSLSDSDGYVRQIILTALAPCDSLNPYQQNLGLRDTLTFSVPGPELVSRCRVEFKRIFDQLERGGLASLVAFDLQPGDAEGDVVAVIRYQNLLSRRTGQLDLPLHSTR